MRRTLTVAANDFLNVRRSKLPWGVTALYLVMMLLLFYFAGQGTGNGGQAPALADVLRVMSVIGALIVPLVALVTAYLAVAGERETGSIKYRLSLPTTRLEFVLGKFLSRAAVVTLGLLISLTIAGLYGAYGIHGLDFDAGTYLVFVGLTLLFGVSYVGIAVGLSSLTASRSRAMGASIAYFFVFNVFWLLSLGPLSIENVVDWITKQLGWSLAIQTKVLIKTLSPGFAYAGSLGSVVHTFRLTSAVPNANPWYLQPWAQVLVMVGWMVVPLTLGYLRFEGAELG